MAGSNAKNIIDFFKEMAKGTKPEEKLVLDRSTQSLKLVSPDRANSPGQMIVNPKDIDMFLEVNIPSVVIQNFELENILSRVAQEHGSPVTLQFQTIDDADVYRLSDTGSIKGYFLSSSYDEFDQRKILPTYSSQFNEFILIFYENGSTLRAFQCCDSKLLELQVIVTPSKTEIFSRTKGIYETSVIANKSVLVIGLGSGGSPIALELVKQGVQKITLIDNDKLEAGNISRHICGVKDIGRYKTKAVAELLLNKSPYLEIETFEIDIVQANHDLCDMLFSKVDLVLCCTDNRKSKLVVNRLCIEYGKTCIYGGAFQRAYGGEVIKVTPYKSMCYQCFVSSMPDIASDNEISNHNQARENAYADDPSVAVEPGLSTDIAPISIFMSKLAILELLRDCEHTLQNLYEDFSQSLYIWFNRREVGTEWYRILAPLGNDIQNMSILRWYGIDTTRNEACPVCGDNNTTFHLTTDEEAMLFG